MCSTYRAMAFITKQIRKIAISSANFANMPIIFGEFMVEFLNINILLIQFKKAISGFNFCIFYIFVGC